MRLEVLRTPADLHLTTLAIGAERSDGPGITIDCGCSGVGSTPVLLRIDAHDDITIAMSAGTAADLIALMVRACDSVRPGLGQRVLRAATRRNERIPIGMVADYSLTAARDLLQQFRREGLLRRSLSSTRTDDR